MMTSVVKVVRVLLALLLCLPAAMPRALAVPVSVHVADGDIRAVIAGVAQMGGLAVVVDGSVSGTVSLEIDGIEAEELLRTLATAKGLAIERRGDVLMLTRPGVGSTALLHAYTFPVRHADLETARQAVLVALWREDYAAGDSGGGSTSTRNSKEDTERRVLADSGTGTLVLLGSAVEADAARAVLAAVDRPARQVSLEAKVIAIQKDAARELGVEWEWSKVPQYPSYTREYDYYDYYDSKNDHHTERVPTWKAERQFNGRNEPMAGIIQFGRGPEGHPFEFYYGAKINALITDGKAEMLSRPNIVTLQGREAVINIGSEVPIPTVTSTNTATTTSITYRDAGIILRCTPRVSPEGQITVAVHTEVSSPAYNATMGAYEFRKRSADTAVRLSDGGTMVIGGLIGSEETRAMTKVPLLGALFRSSRKGRSESEIMIFLTARVVPEEAAPSSP